MALHHHAVGLFKGKDGKYLPTNLENERFFIKGKTLRHAPFGKAKLTQQLNVHGSKSKK